MGDIINLRQARKAKMRADGESLADANRAKHGRSKPDKLLADAVRKKHEAVLDAARREPVAD